MSDLKIHIRWLIRRDMPEVMAIETASFDFPYTEDDIIAYLRHRNCIALIAEDLNADGRVVGFVIYDLLKTHITIQDLAVGPSWRRQGVGSAIIAKLITKLSPQRRTRICLGVWDRNLDAQLFLRAQGFKAFDIVKDAWDDYDGDRYDFEYRLSLLVAAQ